MAPEAVVIGPILPNTPLPEIRDPLTGVVLMVGFLFSAKFFSVVCFRFTTHYDIRSRTGNENGFGWYARLTKWNSLAI